ncbi:Putative ribosomal protein S10 [Septoria linicola]|uniref:Small ribosomal subunit protein uS10m n=1 Tax=Septoria linicola TaxID=215465 RepID=A0A9Q9ARZ8_9PEZI|nr:putative ribosomal protein S10 [Septoria linicola]USW51475.1 Putative ribosomal protein S10 [Septoria linicola]
MATPSYARSLTSAVKRLKVRASKMEARPHTHQNIQLSSSSTPAAAAAAAAAATQTRQIQHSPSRPAQPLSPNLERELSQIRLPKAVQATYLAPLYRSPPPLKSHESRDTVCQLQLRSYNVRNLEVFADFALRAAYFLNLSAIGPFALPRKTERWTVPRSNFVHKKSQENFERITMRREIKIRDGDAEVVSVWLAFLRKHQYYGVGMKANVWEYGGLEAPKEMDEEAKRVVDLLGKEKVTAPVQGVGQGRLAEKMIQEPFKAAWGAYAPSVGAESVPSGNERVQKVKVDGGVVQDGKKEGRRRAKA